MFEHLHASLTGGRIPDAYQIADALVRRGQLREALAAYAAIARVAPDQLAVCTALMGDVHAHLGELPQARAAYEAARKMGAPNGWIAQREAWVATLAAQREIYVSAGGLEASFGSNQNGAVIVRPHYVAFLPTERATSLVGIAAKVVAAGAVGATWVRFGSPRDPRALARSLAAVSASELDVVAPRAARELGGLCFAKGEATFEEQRLLFGRRLYFRRGKERLHVGFWKEAVASPVFLRLAEAWRAPRA